MAQLWPCTHIEPTLRKRHTHFNRTQGGTKTQLFTFLHIKYLYLCASLCFFVIFCLCCFCCINNVDNQAIWCQLVRLFPLWFRGPSQTMYYILFTTVIITESQKLLNSFHYNSINTDFFGVFFVSSFLFHVSF